MNLYTREAIIEFSREFILDKVLMLLAYPLLVPDMDPTPLPLCIWTDFPIVLHDTIAP